MVLVMRTNWTLLLTVTAGLILAGCSDKPSGGPTDTYRSGQIEILVDATLQPVLEREIVTFQNEYKDAKIQATFLPEGEAFKRFMDQEDTARLLIATRALKPVEEQRVRSWQITPKSYRLGYDALAIVVHPDNPDTSLTLPQLTDLLTGRATQWRAFGTARPGKQDAVVVVFDHAKSSTVRFLADSLLAPDTLATSRLYAAGSNPAVIDYVAKTPNAIGFIGYNWISDREDPRVQASLRKVRLLRLPHADDPTKLARLEVSPVYYLRNRKYPLSRVVYVHNREGRSGLGTGFANFLTGNIGQEILFKSDLYPVYAKKRIVEFVEE